MAFENDTDIRYCITNDRAAFLDLRTDRYFCLPLRLDAAFRSIIRDASAAEIDGDARQALARIGVVSMERHQAISRPVSIAPPTRDQTDLAQASVSPFDFATACICYGRAKHSLKRRSIREIVAHRARPARPVTTRSSPLSTEAARRHAAAFSRIRTVVKVHDQCLTWSLAMASYLTLKGCHTSLVIGVKLEPFAAHAWVQTDETVLSCLLEEALLYTPILVA